MSRIKAHSAKAGVAEIEPLATVRALVLLHRCSPRRPAAETAIEWVVVGRGGAAAAVAALRFSTAIANGSAAWPQKTYGPFTVLQENAPAPDDQGGTRVFLAETDVCVYRATTAWSGAAAAEIPA